MQLRSALLAATVLAMPIAASAQPVTGLYVGLGAGVNIESQEKVKNLAFPTLNPLGSGLSTSGNVGGSTGFAGVLSLGWGFGNGLRAEIEGNYRNNNQDHVSGCHKRAFGCSRRHDRAEVRRDGQRAVSTSTASRRGSCRTWCRRRLPGHQREVQLQEWGRCSWHGDWCRPAPGRQRWRKCWHVCLPGDRRRGVPAAADCCLAWRPPPSIASWVRREIAVTAQQRRRLRQPARLLLPCRPQFSSARPTTTRSWSACATTSACPAAAAARRLRFRRRPRPAPTWCSSIGTRRHSPIVRARSSTEAADNSTKCSTRGSR